MLNELMADLERNILRVVLKEAGDNLEVAADQLGITVEDLKERIERLGMVKTGNGRDKRTG